MTRHAESTQPEFISELSIIFRRIDELLPDNDGDADCYWFVEAHADTQYPLGLATVKQLDDGRFLLKFIFVVDFYHRSGIGRLLIAACQARWPDIDLGDAVTKQGQALLDSVRRNPPQLPPSVPLYETGSTEPITLPKQSRTKEKKKRPTSRQATTS